MAHLTSAVQLGFIIGTLLFALLTIADRFSPSKVFFISAFIASIFNFLMILNVHSMHSLFLLRFFTGFFLAGIYPVGMKIASDYYKEGLGKSLGFLVGALVLGTAFPHVLKFFQDSISWRFLVYITTGLAFLGGMLILVFIPDGPYKTKLTRFDLTLCVTVFKVKNFRIPAFGYFGHMWELYAFWTFIPVILHGYLSFHENVQFNISLYSFVIIATGALSCVLSGYLSQRFTSKKVATIALSLSCLCCLLSPLIFVIKSEVFFLVFLVFWGMVVIADSPLFSTLVAQNAPNKAKGTALTIVNSIGFAITIISIELLNVFKYTIETRFLFLILVIGPIMGLIELYKSFSKPSQ